MDAVTDTPAARLAATDETYPIPAHGWTCFHCGETFLQAGAARDHFGATPQNTAGCLIDRVALEIGTNTQRGRGLQMALRKVEQDNATLQQRIKAQAGELADMGVYADDAQRVVQTEVRKREQAEHERDTARAALAAVVDAQNKGEREEALQAGYTLLAGLTPASDPKEPAHD